MDFRYDIALRETGRVVTGRALGSGIADALRELGADRIVVLAEEAMLVRARGLADALDAPLIPVEGGEALKSWARVEDGARSLLAAGATRRSLLVTMGGGATTDYGAFLASVFMRGMRCALIPTTLLAMVDAALGGKNGVDLGPHKNLLGAIRQPELVVCDVAFLESLDDGRLAEGLVEVIKKAAMLDGEVFEALEADLERLLARDAASLLAAVEAAVAMKLEVVAQDARESDRRMLLNFGHTVGHAYEALSDYGLSHGTAVARGMEVECRMIASPVGGRLCALLGRLPLAGTLPEVGPAELWALMRRDKKSSGGAVRIAAPRALGRGEIAVVEEADLVRALA